MIRRAIGKAHLWIGLLLSLPLATLGLTGSILVFEDELRAAFAPAAQVQPGEAHAVGDVIAAARAAAPAGSTVTSYFAPPAPGRAAAVRLQPGRQNAGGGMIRVDVDPVTLAAVPNSTDDFLRQVFYLHSTLLLKNREGRQIAGWFGVAMLTLALSGVVNWWPRRSGWRRAFSVGRGARGFRLYRELHGAAGIWGFSVLAVVSFGGIYLAFPESVRSIVNPVLPARDLRAAATAVKVAPVAAAERIGVDDAIAVARQEIPDAALAAVFLPQRPDQPYRVALRRDGGDRHDTPVTVFVDPGSRRTVEVFDPRRFSAGETMLAAQHALHAGQGFGPVWKILVFVAGLLPSLFTVTGVAMWWGKRPRAMRPADGVVDDGYTARRAGE